MFTKHTFKILETMQQHLITLGEVKQSLRISYDYDDHLLAGLIEFAIDYAEKFTSLSIKTRVVELTSNINGRSAFTLEYAPVLEIRSVELRRNAITSLAPEYHIDNDRWVLCLKEALDGHELKVVYLCGFALSNMKQSIKQGILLHIAQMYDKAADHSTEISSEIRNLYLMHRKVKI